MSGRLNAMEGADGGADPVNSAERQGWRHWLGAAHHPARKDGAIAAAVLVLPWVVALALELLHYLNATAITILASASIGLPAVWLAWVPIRNANRSGTAGSASPTHLGDAATTPPAKTVRVSQADPRQLGVHAAISVPGVSNEVPPEYVPRDVDAAESGVRSQVVAAAERGGFMLLVGGSSVGKTRCAFEAVKALLPNWWLVHPDGPAEITMMAGTLPPQTVVWLDELQRYLDGEHGLSAGLMRALLNASHPAVIIGTLWPNLYTAYTELPVSDGPDPHAREREVLDLATVIRVGAEFSSAEENRARAAAARDRRLAVALDATEYGLTQTLAAAPQLVGRWEDAHTARPYAWAVLTAALDAARLGTRAPLTAGFLQAAAPGYCTNRQQAEAPDDWFEQALAYATAGLHGAASALAPTGTGMGQIAGYNVADYLIQYASRERRYVRVPASIWDAFISHIRDPADNFWLADSARKRLLYRYAIPLYRCAADAGDRNAPAPLAKLLADRGDPDGAEQVLRSAADAGDELAASQLANLLADRGDVDQAARILVAPADAGDDLAAYKLADLLAERGDLDGLRARADAGDENATLRLADLLASQGDLDGLRAWADAGSQYAARQVEDLLAERGDLDVLRARTDAGDENAGRHLARLLAERGDLDVLRARTDAGDKDAAYQLADLLADRGDVDQAAQMLVALADSGHQAAAVHLAWLLAERGDLDGLRARTDAGDSSAASVLAWLLAERGDVDGLRPMVDAGDSSAASVLAWLLAERGDVDELRAMIDAPLAESVDLDELRARAEAGDKYAAYHMAELLAVRGDLDEAVQILAALADTGGAFAAIRLAGLLAERGDMNGLLARIDVGDAFAARRLADLLAERGDLDGLRSRADVGDAFAARRLAGLLAERGDLDGLLALIDAGDEGAAEELPGLLAKQGRGEDAEQLRRFGLNPDRSIACA